MKGVRWIIEGNRKKKERRERRERKTEREKHKGGFFWHYDG